MIRKAGERDVEIIAEYNRKMAVETEGLELDEKTVLSGVKHGISNPDKAVYYVYEIDGKIIGQLMITKEWSDWRDGEFWWIQSVYVAEEYRQQGIFRDLYNYIIKLVEKDSTACGLRLYVERNNNKAQETYKKMGMEETHYLLYEAKKD